MKTFNLISPEELTHNLERALVDVLDALDAGVRFSASELAIIHATAFEAFMAGVRP